MQDCRNCGSRNLRDLGFIGEVAPFFLKRVLNMEVKASVARHPLRLLARRLCALPQRLFAKVYGSNVFMEMQVCLDCCFIQTKHAFSDEGLRRLYADYRSDTYNEERIRYEPTYAALANEIGVGDQEVDSRVRGLTAWLSDQIQHEKDFSMLDYGGSDGRFLPGFEGQRFLFEVSNISPVPGVIRVSDEAELGTYSYVQITHVLEHVPEPLALLKRVACLVKPSGYLYVEVPQDLTDSEIAELKSGTVRHGLPIHEHINMYCSSSVARLLEATGLELARIERTKMDLGWATGTIVRALGRKSE